MKILKRFFKTIIEFKLLSKPIVFSEPSSLEIGIDQINNGIKKVLNKNSIDYKEIVYKNREAWKKLADL